MYLLHQLRHTAEPHTEDKPTRTFKTISHQREYHQSKYSVLPWDLLQRIWKVILKSDPLEITLFSQLYLSALCEGSFTSFNKKLEPRKKAVTQDNLTKQELLWNHFWTKEQQCKEQKRTSTFKKAKPSADQSKWITSHCRLIRYNSTRGL